MALAAKYGLPFSLTPSPIFEKVYPNPNKVNFFGVIRSYLSNANEKNEYQIMALFLTDYNNGLIKDWLLS